MNLTDPTPAQMADRTGVSIDTLRYYEKEGLLVGPSSSSGSPSGGPRWT